MERFVRSTTGFAVSTILPYAGHVEIKAAGNGFALVPVEDVAAEILTAPAPDAAQSRADEAAMRALSEANQFSKGMRHVNAS